MISLSTTKTILFTIAPFLIPKLLNYYRALRAKSQTSPLPIQPIPKVVYRSLNILFIAALLSLISTLPHFAPENIFKITSARLQTSSEVLFSRLATARGPSGLTDADTTLKPKLASLDSRLLYLTYGPDVLTNCPFCTSDEPTTYLYYALPSFIIPHIFNLLALGLATSNAVTGQWGTRWRTTAASLGVCLAVLNIWLFTAYNWKANARALRPEQYVLFYWRMRVARGVMLSLADAVIAALMYLSSTNRAFVTPPSAQERMEVALKTLEQSRGKMSAMAVVRNAVARDEGLRRRTEGYWVKEGRVMGEVMDEREVVEGVRSALESRVRVATVEEEARKFADALVVGPPPQQDIS
ncbi:uncharacterized protein KY384_006906 [Bacidia gigantensis]|uniref:uncharacterized protein n=1 Tax=Bacidia gigantensis TaxID=2732470 RepID=UPI001D035F77|nr:uncharacterized protein KY384_006906 [Bacidia gigantensis]KAG8527990.1 hypothetical protein KY384_006906 [Bacidia gigantensis]